jgi:hypothetical protein
MALVGSKTPNEKPDRSARLLSGHAEFLRGQRLVAVFLLGLLLLNFPLLALFNKSGEWLGIPVLYWYLFGAWATLIGLMALIIEKKK